MSLETVAKEFVSSRKSSPSECLIEEDERAMSSMKSRGWYVGLGDRDFNSCIQIGTEP